MCLLKLEGNHLVLWLLHFHPGNGHKRFKIIPNFPDDECKNTWNYGFIFRFSTSGLLLRSMSHMSEVGQLYKPQEPLYHHTLIHPLLYYPEYEFLIFIPFQTRGCSSHICSSQKHFNSYDIAKAFPRYYPYKWLTNSRQYYVCTESTPIFLSFQH